MPIEIVTAIIGLIGVLLGVIPTYFFMRQRSLAEIEKLKAETDKIKAEAEKIRAELQSPHQEQSVPNYNIKIETPQAGAELEKVEVTGSYTQKPPDGTLRLFTVSSDGRFWPQKIVRFDMSKHKWYGSVSLGGDRAYGMKIAIALVGQPARILWDYYYKVISNKNGSVSIEGWHPDDVVICDEIGITRV